MSQSHYTIFLYIYITFKQVKIIFSIIFGFYFITFYLIDPNISLIPL